MAGMAGTIRVMRQTWNSVKMPSIMHISLSDGQFNAAGESSLYPSLLRSVDPEMIPILGWESLRSFQTYQTCSLITRYVFRSYLPLIHVVICDALNLDHRNAR